ncbi:unnamed protein product [marine sediment metagenome]|uniref:Uncharacterized protein n=1 Tax=marine sediment metagenome TaxID=412755 RepID=X1JZP8_9ZZZZ
MADKKLYDNLYKVIKANSGAFLANDTVLTEILDLQIPHSYCARIRKVIFEDSKKFWEESCELTAKGRFVRFVDGESVEVIIKDWTRHQVDTNWGRKPCIKTDSDEFLKVESKRLRFILSEFADKKVKLRITRYDSAPNPLLTHWTVEKIPLTKQKKISGKNLEEL